MRMRTYARHAIQTRYENVRDHQSNAPRHKNWKTYAQNARWLPNTGKRTFKSLMASAAPPGTLPRSSVASTLHNMIPRCIQVIWSHVVPFRPNRSRLIPSGPAWSHLILSPRSHVWSRQVPSGSVWSHLVPSGPTWIHLVPPNRPGTRTSQQS